MRAAIVKAARAQFTARGYRKANIASIARKARIGKGTVYLFFRSKADLFAEVLEQAEGEMRAAIGAELERPFADIRERIGHFLRAVLVRFEGDPLLRIVVDPVEAAAFFRELRPEAVERLRRSDRTYFERLVAEWRAAGWLRDVDADVFAALGRGLFAVSLHRDLVGESTYPAVVDLLVTALATELAPADDGT